MTFSITGFLQESRGGVRLGLGYKNEKASNGVASETIDSRQIATQV
jgi:hypothetical protein